MTNQASAQEMMVAQKEQSQTHTAGVRQFYVIERAGMFFKGYNLGSNQVEFTADIMDARWFTHTRAAKPRAGERLLQLNLPVAANTISLLV